MPSRSRAAYRYFDVSTSNQPPHPLPALYRRPAFTVCPGRGLSVASAFVMLAFCSSRVQFAKPWQIFMGGQNRFIYV